MTDAGVHTAGPTDEEVFQLLITVAKANLATMEEQCRRMMRWGKSHREIDIAIEETRAALTKARQS